MKQPISERYIAECIADNPEEGFRLIYLHYARRLLGVAYRYVADGDVAKDLLQESMCKAYKGRERYKYSGEGSLMAWLSRIVINESLNHLKSFNVKSMDRLDDNEYVAQELADDDEGELLSLVDPEVLISLIAQLPKGYRVVLSMYAIEGYSHKEIAQKLGIKERSSSSQYHRAKQELKRMVEQWIRREK